MLAGIEWQRVLSRCTRAEKLTPRVAPPLPGSVRVGATQARGARRVSQPSRHFALTYRCKCTRRVDVEHVDESKVVSFALSRAPLAHRSALGGARARVRAIIDGDGSVCEL